MSAKRPEYDRAGYGGRRRGSGASYGEHRATRLPCPTENFYRHPVVPEHFLDIGAPVPSHWYLVQESASPCADSQYVGTDFPLTDNGTVAHAQAQAGWTRTFIQLDEANQGAWVQFGNPFDASATSLCIVFEFALLATPSVVRTLFLVGSNLQVRVDNVGRMNVLSGGVSTTGTPVYTGDGVGLFAFYRDMRGVGAVKLLTMQETIVGTYGAVTNQTVKRFGASAASLYPPSCALGSIYIYTGTDAETLIDDGPLEVFRRRECTVRADGLGDYTTVQAAVTAAPKGTRIDIAPGTYTENVIIPAGKDGMELRGAGRNLTTIQFDESTFIDPNLVATPVITNNSDSITFRGLKVWNLADDVLYPGGSGGVWDAAIRNYADKIRILDCHLRGDHDTLLMYSTAFGGGNTGRVFVSNCLIQGRGDFIASFAPCFIQNSVLEQISDPGHYLFQMGTPAGSDALVVRECAFIGTTTDPDWPFGVTDLNTDARVYLINNTMLAPLGTERPVVHFHLAGDADSADVYQHGNTAGLWWSDWSVRVGAARIDTPNDGVIFGMTAAAAASITPLWLFTDWDPMA